VLFDSWYASLDNLKAIRAHGWRWFTRLKSNRLVNPDGQGNVPLRTLDIPPEGRLVHLKGYGFIKVFRTVSRDGDVKHWATSDRQMTPAQRKALAKQGWGIETYHRGLSPSQGKDGVEKAQVRTARAQRRHILLSLQAFVRLEVHRIRTGVSWYEAKATIIRQAIRDYLAHPLYLLTPTA
jgi:hypothetical protein